MISFLKEPPDYYYPENKYAEEAALKFTVLQNSLFNDVFEGSVLLALNEKEKKGISIGTVNLSSGNPFAYLQKWDEDHINGTILVIECPVITNEIIMKIDNLFYHFLAVKPENDKKAFEEKIQSFNRSVE